MNCANCPFNLYVPCPGLPWGFCLNLQHLVVASSDCKKEGAKQ